MHKETSIKWYIKAIYFHGAVYFLLLYLLVKDKSLSLILISQYFCSPFITQYFYMTYPPGNSPSKYHHLFIWKPWHKGNTEVLSYISSIWEDDRIEQLENIWKCLWCNVIFQGISVTKALYHVIRTILMHIERCRASIYQDHLSRYNDLKYPHMTFPTAHSKTSCLAASTTTICLVLAVSW